MSERVFTLPEIARLAGAEYRTLKVWVERGLVSPSVRATTGTGHVELYSERDAEVLCKLADCRRRGLEMEQLAIGGGKLTYSARPEPGDPQPSTQQIQPPKTLGDG